MPARVGSAGRLQCEGLRASLGEHAVSELVRQVRAGLERFIRPGERRRVGEGREQRVVARAALVRAREQRVYDALRAKREYAFFNYENRRRADPKLDKWQFILFFLVVPLVLESLLNGNFFAEASDFGLVGGAATAVIISALNIALGFSMGIGPARYCQHAKSSHLFWALPAYAGMWVGQRIQSRLDERGFAGLLYVLYLAMGASFLARTIG